MKKVVSATLAGALAVGMVPAMALADDAIELQAQTTAQLVNAGTLVLKDGQTAGQVFTYDAAKAQGLVPVEIIPQNETDPENYVPVNPASLHYIDLNAENTLVGWTGFTVDGKQVEGAHLKTGAPTKAGKYAVFAMDMNGNWCKQGVSFSIVQQAYTGVEIYEVNGKNLLDETFTYKHATYEFGKSTQNGKLALKTANETALDAYETFTVIDPVTKLVAAPTYAGTYTVVAEDTDGNLADLELSFTIDAYDVNNPDVTIADTTGGTAQIVGIPAELAGFYKIASMDKTLTATSDNGYYTATIGVDEVAINNGTAAQAAGRAKSIIGSKTVTFAKVDQVVTPIVKYNEQAWPTDWEIDYSEKKAKAFNADLVTVELPDGTELEADEYSLSVVKVVNGKKVAAQVSDLANAGEYEVRAVLNAEALDFEYAGTSKANALEVTNGDIETAGIAYVFDGSPLVGTSDTEVYNGTDYMSKLEIKVTDDKGKAVDAADYTVTIKKIEDAKGDDVLPINQVVTEIKDAGKYQIIVTSTEYQIATGKDVLTVTISQAPVAPAIDSDYVNDNGVSAFFWTGKDIVVPLIYDNDGKAATPMVAVPEGAAKITIKKFTDKDGKDAKYAPKAFNAAGTYVIDIADADPADNYTVTERTGWTVVVEDTNVFIDVTSDAWYADEVYAIAKTGVMGGYGNGKFGPMDNAERQDVALMMFRMLTGKQLVGTDAEDWENQGLTQSVILPFSDANERAYYANALWYVNKNGIMTGYGDSDEFGVGDDITREQVAAILFRSKGFTVDTLLASALDAYADADEISKYAVEAMEWAVSEGIFGVNAKYLNPGDPISRAELAAVFVRFMDATEWTVPVVKAGTNAQQ